MTPHGFHHVTAVTAKAKENVLFYTNVLGFRLVKKTVNQDDVSAYHLYYADAIGTPGTDMTFFDWKQVPQKGEGTDQISRTYFRVNGTTALKYWKHRFQEHRIQHSEIVTIHGREGILFEDFEGQRLGVLNDQGVFYEGEVWDKIIPTEYAFRGFSAVELSVPDIAPIENTLIDILGWEKSGTYRDPLSEEPLTIFQMEEGGPGKEVYVRIVAAQPLLASTAGSVHHVAFRLKDENEMQKWHARLNEKGMQNSGIIDRFYFTSLYFRISPGILFELATDGPGFSIDENSEHLGETLALPPFLEPNRTTIEAGLLPL